MKKLIISVLIAVSCLSAFSLENDLALRLTPYVFQGQRTAVISNEDKDVDSQWASYGIGGNATYRFFVWNDLYTELGVDFDFFFFKGEEYKCINVMGFAGAGYRYKINGKYEAYAHIDLGADSILKDKNESRSFVIKFGSGISYVISDNWTLDCEIDGSIGFARKKNSSSSENYTQYTTFRIIPYLGATYSL